jgi:chromosome partitioning protein
VFILWNQSLVNITYYSIIGFGIYKQARIFEQYAQYDTYIKYYICCTYYTFYKIRIADIGSIADISPPLLFSPMHILSFANNKGGVGKTTSALAVAHTLHAQGVPVLLIDADPQANASKTFPTVTEVPTIVGLGSVLEGRLTLNQAVEQIQPNFWLLRATSELARQEKVLGSQPDYVFALREMLTEGFDLPVQVVILDTPPNLGPLTVAALVASQHVFIPLKPEFFANEGMTALQAMVGRLRKSFAPTLRVSGIFFTEYARSYRRALHHQVVASIERDPLLTGLVMQTTIRENVALPESQSMGQSIHAWAPTSNGANDYQTLTNEIREILAI